MTAGGRGVLARLALGLGAVLVAAVGVATALSPGEPRAVTPAGSGVAAEPYSLDSALTLPAAGAGTPPAPLAASPRPATGTANTGGTGGTGSTAGALPPLGPLHAPDLLVRAPAPLSTSQLAALQAASAATSVLDLGTIDVAGRSARLVGVEPASFRAFTPQQTASSEPLWRVIAAGGLGPDEGLARERDLALGAPLLPGGPDVAAIASYGVPGIEVVTDRGAARRLGARPATGVLLSAPGRSVEALATDVRAAVPGAQVVVLRPAEPTVASDRPTTYRELYVASARTCPGLSWQVLAAIGQIESGHGKTLGPSSAGALGPMQFLPSTWAAYGIDGDGDGRADILNPLDAVPSAASYLCRAGAGNGQQGLYSAIFAYNHADWYVREVLALAAQYR